MNNIDPGKILEYGIIGLGFLLAFLSFLLLKKALNENSKPALIKPIYVFMFFSLALCAVGIIDKFAPASQESSTSYRKEIDDLKKVNNELISELNTIEADNNSKQDQITELQDLLPNFKTVQDENFNLISQINALEVEYNSKQDQINELNDRILRYKGDENSAKQLIAKLKQLLNKKDTAFLQSEWNALNDNLTLIKLEAKKHFIDDSYIQSLEKTVNPTDFKLTTEIEQMLSHLDPE